jgi:hypothetical protein
MPTTTELPEVPAELVADLPGWNDTPLPGMSPSGGSGGNDPPRPASLADPEPLPRRPRRTTTGASSAASFRTEAAVAEGMAKALVGVLTLGFGIAWFLTRRPGRTFRQPTTNDVDAMAKPLGRVGARHVPIDLAPAVAQSIVDASEAGGALLAYLQRGPLIEHEPPTPPEEA